jgi:epoxyqueuosine reductase
MGQQCAGSDQASAAEAMKAEIAQSARDLGFDSVGFAAVEGTAEMASGLHGFLDQGLHGEMDWMARNAAIRADPQAIWRDARTIIVLGMNYGPAGDPLAATRWRDRGAISVYARGVDYHKVMKRRLKQFARLIHGRYDAEVKVFVDTAPVMEKPAAQRSGIGWQGKHTNLVSRDHGAWLFLGEVFTTLDLPPDAPDTDHCGSCRACLDVCPTNAFLGPNRLDARRCISYLTIEHKGHIPREFRAAMGNRIYGCDDCLAVCPWNKFARTARELAFMPRIELGAPRLADLAGLDDAGFRAILTGSPIKRIGRDRFVRNVLIAIGNSGDSALARAAKANLGDVSPLVRAMAVWALSRLLGRAAFDRLRDRHSRGEADAAVRAEWETITPP